MKTSTQNLTSAARLRVSHFVGKLIVVTLMGCGLTLITPRSQAQGGVPLWTNRYDGPVHGYDGPAAVAVDGSGNVFVVGSSYSSDIPSDYTTIAYSSAGLPLWTNRYNGPGNGHDFAGAVTVDGSGNVLVGGLSYGSDGSYYWTTLAYSGAGVPLWTNAFGVPGAGPINGSSNYFGGGSPLDSGGHHDVEIVAYSSAGAPLWTNRYNGPGNGDDLFTAAAVDSGGNVIVTGASFGSDLDYATLAYSGAGVPLWTNRYSVPGLSDDRPVAMAVDKSGNVFVTGESRSSVTYKDYATVAYSGAGVPLWTNRFNAWYSGGGSSVDIPTALAVDQSGNVFVTGKSGGLDGHFYCATVAYSGAGVSLWTNRYLGPGNVNDEGTALAVDASGNVFVTAASYGSDGSLDCATLAYSGAGVPLWTNRYSGPGSVEDYPSKVAVDGSGNVFVLVHSGGDWVAIKYSSSLPPNHAPLVVLNSFPLFAILPSETNLFILSPNNAAATVVLDGSQSSDADGDPLQFVWYADGQTNALATGALVTHPFAVGVHTVRLVVSDGHDTAAAQVNFEVIAPSTAGGQLMLLVDDANLDSRNKQPLLATLIAAMSSFERGNGTAALNQLSAFQNQVRAQVASWNPALAAELTAASQKISEVVSGR